MIVDAHQHFWRVARGDYGWLTPSLAPLYRDFLPADLKPLLSQNGIDGTFLVQAAPTVAETEFLLEIAHTTPFVLGVIGWVDLADNGAVADIARLARHPKLVGLRPMLQDIAEDDWMLHDALRPAIAEMIAQGLAFDALVFPRHLPHLRKFIDCYPDLRVVIDHAAKPDIAGRDFDTWAQEIAAIAQESAVYCKLSGLLTQAGDDWTLADLKPYARHLFDHFGAARVMWGSDWPVLNLASSYDNWFSVAKSLAGVDVAASGVFGQNACAFYKRR